MNQTKSDMSIEEIVVAFETFQPVYQREAVDAAIAHREEITPHLIESLENIAADPEKYDADEDYFMHVYALMLLGHFKESRAHKAIIDAVGLPDEYPNRLFGDSITEDLSMILHRTNGGSLDLIKSLVCKQDAYEYSRGAALRALGFAVADGLAKREDITQFLVTLLTGDEAEEGSPFWSFVVEELCNLYATEAIDDIDQAFQDKLILPFFYSYDNVKDTFEEGFDAAMIRLSENMERYDLDDMHGSMEWWACFRSQEKASPLFKPTSYSVPVSRPAHSALPIEPHKPIAQPTSKKRKQLKKKKRKAAKSSRKKNRRR